MPAINHSESTLRVQVGLLRLLQLRLKSLSFVLQTCCGRHGRQRAQQRVFIDLLLIVIAAVAETSLPGLHGLAFTTAVQQEFIMIIVVTRLPLSSLLLLLGFLGRLRLHKLRDDGRPRRILLQ